MNFFKKIFQNEESEDPIIDDKTSTKACVALLLETSMADEILDESELMALKNTLQKDFQINEDEIDELIDLAKENVEDSTSLYEFTRDINDNFDAAERVKLIESMWKIAYADGNIDKYEEHIIRKVSNLIYVAHSDFIKAKLSAKEQI
ncbi:TerB family tellurite resistance protein [Gammaproteobacteria bacterium]|nr:TerB family tellurite resistance protein [Gammaproteobacteria bacterium]